MAIRLRLVTTGNQSEWVALCAAKSVAKPGDIYLDDGMHLALSDKFARDFNSMYDFGIPEHIQLHAAVEQEESNNPNRDEWDITFGGKGE